MKAMEESVNLGHFYFQEVNKKNVISPPPEI